MNNQTNIDKCNSLKLSALAEMFSHQENEPEYNDMSFSERLALLLDAQLQANSEKRIATLTRQAKLREPNYFIEDIDYT
jgi:hypothetical protein